MELFGVEKLKVKLSIIYQPLATLPKMDPLPQVMEKIFLWKTFWKIKERFACGRLLITQFQHMPIFKIEGLVLKLVISFVESTRKNLITMLGGCVSSLQECNMDTFRSFLFLWFFSRIIVYFGSLDLDRNLVEGLRISFEDHYYFVEYFKLQILSF